MSDQLGRVQIRHRFTGETLRTVDAETLRGAYLSRANLTRADLTGADLTDALIRDAIMPSPADTEPPGTLQEAAERTRRWLKTHRWLRRKWLETPGGFGAGNCAACLHGAAVIAGGPLGSKLSQKLTELGFTFEWNDAFERKVADVYEALEKVATETRETAGASQ